MSLVWSSGFNGITDPDAQAYLAAVETADGQAIEGDVALAINNFVVGCKLDGIWNAIKASCILAGARTLSGALVPLKGTAPTNNNFVSGDYDRETGLVGDGSTKYLDSNRANNADPQNSKHIAVYASSASANLTAVFLGTDSDSWIAHDTSDLYFRVNGSSSASINVATRAGFFGATRAESNLITYRQNQSSGSVGNTSASPSAQAHTVYRQPNGNNKSSARLSFYSIGESLDLALLDARVSTLMTDIGAAIP